MLCSSSPASEPPAFSHLVVFRPFGSGAVQDDHFRALSSESMSHLEAAAGPSESFVFAAPGSEWPGGERLVGMLMRTHPADRNVHAHVHPPLAGSHWTTSPRALSTTWPSRNSLCLHSQLEDEDFEDLTSSLSASALLAALNDDTTQDALLDALARLQEERARSDRLERQVELARALAGLPNCGERPAKAATCVSAHWRGCVGRRAVAASRLTRRVAASSLIQARARLVLSRRASSEQQRYAAASRVRDALRGYLAKLRNREGGPPTHSALTRCALRGEEELTTLRRAHAAIEAELRAALAKKDAALDAAADRIVQSSTRAQIIGRWRSMQLSAHLEKEHGDLAQRHEALQTEHEALQMEHRRLRCEHAEQKAVLAVLAQEVEFCDANQGAAPSASYSSSSASTVANAMTAEADTAAAAAAAASATATARVHELEALVEEIRTSAAVEHASLSAQLDEQRTVARGLEESLSQAAIDKERAEDLASTLLAEKLSKSEELREEAMMSCLPSSSAATQSFRGSLISALWGTEEDASPSSSRSNGAVSSGGATAGPGAYTGGGGGGSGGGGARGAGSGGCCSFDELASAAALAGAAAAARAAAAPAPAELRRDRSI